MRAPALTDPLLLAVLWYVTRRVIGLEATFVIERVIVAFLPLRCVLVAGAYSGVLDAEHW